MYRHSFVLLPLLMASFAAAREHPRSWIEVRSPRFTIITNSNEKQGRRIALQFERMSAIFQEAYPQLEHDPESAVVMLAVKDKDQFRILEPGSYRSKNSLPLHGMFVGASDKSYILMRLDSQAGNPYPVVYHEYTHLFLHQTGERMPLWLNEGLAEFYQSTEIHDQDVWLGELNQQHLMLLRQEKLLPLATLFSVNEKSPYYLEEKKGPVFYAECWALTHYLTLRDYAEKTSKVLQYTRLVNDSIDPVSAATSVFGNLSKLQRILELYIEQPMFNHFETRISKNIDESSFRVESITVSQAEAAQADYLVAAGRAEEARFLFPSAIEEHTSSRPELDALGNERHAQNSENSHTNGGTPLSRAGEATRDQLTSEHQEDLSCPLLEILHGASERASEMVDNLQRFTATEQIEHTEFKTNGKARRSANQLFSYVAEIDQAPSGAFWIEEYRTGKTESDPPPLSDTGTAAFALIFHPKKIGNFEFHCEGRSELHGIPAWQLRFEESPDPNRSFHQIRINRSLYQLRFKGRAWIAADNFDILRLQTDLVAPITPIHLQLEHLDIAYAPVDFGKPNFRVWLPESAAMQISYRGHRYQRVHKFSHFQLFLVVTEQTIKEPIPGPGG
jgi:hypothetical protein